MTTIWIGKSDDLVERLGCLVLTEQQQQQREPADNDADESWTHLQFYERDFQNTPEDISAIIQAIHKQPWVDVQFHQCAGIAPLMSTLFQSSNIECLSFYSCDRFGEEEFTQLRQVFQESSKFSVKTLLLGCIDYDEDDPSTHQWANHAALAVGQGLLLAASTTSNDDDETGSLTSLRISSSKLTDPEAVSVLSKGISISKTLSSSLQTLKLPNLSLSDAHAATIVHALHSISSLTELVLSRNRTIGTETLKSLAKLLSLSSSSLETLDLSACGKLVQNVENDGENSSMTAWNEFVQALPSASALSTLMLEEDGLDDVCMASLASVLPDCQALQRVDLGRNDIHDAGVQSLARALKVQQGEEGRFCPIVKLRLQANPFGNPGADALLEALKTNTSLEFVSIPGKLHAGKHIFHWLHLNKGGRRLMLAKKNQQNQHYQNVPLGLWPHILERVNHRINFWSPGKLNESCRVNVLFHLLHGPALLTRH